MEFFMHGRLCWNKVIRTKSAKMVLVASGVFGLAAFLTSVSFADRADFVSASKVTEGNIARLSSGILEQSQFAHHPLDGELAGKFLDRYLDALDGAHILFIQSDLEDFSVYRTQLAKMTRREGDTRPAYVIFDRYLERLGQQVEFVTNKLQKATFDFTSKDTMIIDREQVPRPKDMDAAKALWLERLRFEYLQEKLSAKSAEDIVKTLTRRYARRLPMMKKFSNAEILELYLNSLTRVYDPHSDYMSYEQLDSFSISMNLSLSGIGARLQSEDGNCKILDLVPGGPAAKSQQLKPNDRIIAVAQKDQPPVDIVDMPLSQAVQLIRGPKGSEVELTIIPADAADDSVRKTLTLVRDEIHLEDQRAKARVLDLPMQGDKTLRVGVIDLPTFYTSMNPNGKDEGASATKDVTLLIKKLKELDVKGIVLDLRQNGGGSLPEAIKLSGLFLREGPIVQTRDPARRIAIDNDPDPDVQYDGPLVILTSRFTASASEILAGAMQDYGRALIVGDTATFGKGTVQTVIYLDQLMERNGLARDYDPGALKVTISKFYRPDGASTQLEGVKADIVLPSLTDSPKFGEASMKNPLEYDKVEPAKHVVLNRVQPYLKSLRENSSARMTSDEGFAYLRQAIEEFRKKQAATEISLNEAERQAEKDKAKAEDDAWEKKLAARPKKNIKEYEVTVKNAGLPGLPPPPEKTEPKPKNPHQKDADSDSKLDRANIIGDLLLTEAQKHPCRLHRPAGQKHAHHSRNRIRY